MLPLWSVLFETRIWNSPGNIRIPFKHDLIIFFYICISLGVGYILSRKTPALYQKLWTWLPSFTIFTLIFTIMIQIYNNSFIFILVTKEIMCASILLALSGFIFGFVIPFMCRLQPQKSLVIAIETGAHSTYFTSLLLDSSISQPEADIAKTAPALCSLLSLTPTIIMVLMFRIYKRYTGKDFVETVYVLTPDEEMTECSQESEEVVNEKETCI